MIIYQFFKKRRAIINSILIAIFSSLLFNTLSDVDGDSVLSVFAQIFNLQTVAGVLTLVSLILLVAVNALIEIMSYVLNKYSVDEQFKKIMLENTSDNIRESITPGNFSWGDDKTVEICEEIIYGWDPEAVRVMRYDDELYSFPTQADKGLGEKSYYFNDADYREYIGQESFQRIISEGNNLPRFMLRGCKPNFSRTEKQLQLYVQRTEWSYCRYVWDRMSKTPGLLAEYAKGITSGLNSEVHMPNSLCLHGIIETSDDRVILAKISQTKFNDKPGTWAVTFGEQIECEDYTDGMTYYSDFIMNAVKRAFYEEFKISGDLYDQLIGGGNGVRVLALDFEGDIYNFSLVTGIRLTCSSRDFIGLIQQRLVTAEATELRAIEYDEIPEILMGYSEHRAEYHPSSYLRLMLIYMHRYGIDRLQREIIRLADKR